MGGVRKSDREMVKIIFWLVSEFCDLEGAVRFSVAVDGIVCGGL